MSREWTDEDGTEYEIVWAPDMKVSLTGPRPSNTNPVWVEPPREEDQRQTPASINYLGEAAWSQSDKSSVDQSRTEKRPYNKSGRYEKIKGFWAKQEAGKVKHEGEGGQG